MTPSWRLSGESLLSIIYPEDGDVGLDLQAVFNRCYDSAPYARLIEYRLEPQVPLLPVDAAWVDALRREKGRRVAPASP